MIYLVGEDARSVPDWFKRRLRDIDRALVAYFNPFKEHFCIDRCIKGGDCLSSDHVSCEKTNVMVFDHMGEAALDKLKSMDAWTKYKAQGANDIEALLRQRRERESAKAEYDAKQKEKAREAYRDAAADNKRQLLKVYDAIKTHDLARPHK